MAKKSRRVRRRDGGPRLSEAQLRRPSAAHKIEEESQAVDTMPSKPLDTAPDFREEYSYVVSDLQRIGILAAALLSGLIILSFIF